MSDDTRYPCCDHCVDRRNHYNEPHQRRDDHVFPCVCCEQGWAFR